MLPEDLNHVLFIYLRSDTNSTNVNRVWLDNLRVCSDVVSDPNEATCSVSDAFYNTDDLVSLDDPQVSDTWTSVCQAVNYSDSDINYAGRTVEDVVLATPVATKSSGGSLGYWCLLLPLLLRRKRVYS